MDVRFPVRVTEVSDDAIIVTGPERDESEAGSLQEVLGAWGAENGVEVQILNDGECISMMEEFIEARPELWFEDIGQD